MLHKYLIDILIMMLNIIAPCNKILYAIINTLHKITTTASIYFAKTHYFGIQSFRKLEVIHNLWQKQKRQMSVKSW